MGQLQQELLDEHLVLDVLAFARLAWVELDHLRPFQPQAIHAESNANAIEVARERAILPEFRQFAECLQEGFLSDVFGFVPIAKKVGGRPDESHTVLADEAREGNLVSFTTTCNPVEFLGCINLRRNGGVSFDHLNLPNIVHDCGRVAGAQTFSQVLLLVPKRFGILFSDGSRVIWFALPPIGPELDRQLANQVAAQSGNEVALSETVKIDAENQTRDLITGKTRFSGNVRVIYGPTTITADVVEVDPTPGVETATATGHVALLDPEGSLTASMLTLKFAARAETAEAENVNASIAGAKFSAKRMLISRTEWQFEDVQGTTCRNQLPLYQVRSRKITIRTSDGGRIQRPSLYLFGKRIVDLPTQKFNLDKRVQGVRIPSVSLRKDTGLGVAWSGSALVSKDTSLAGYIGSFKRAWPTFGLAYSKSFLPSSADQGQLVPRDELSDRFEYSWFETIDVNRPEDERRYLSARRQTAAIASEWNRVSRNGTGEVRVSKAIDAVYERSEPVGNFAYYSQVRLQHVRAERESFRPRAVMLGSVALPKLELAPNVLLQTRLDSSVYASKRLFGWARFSSGVSYQPSKMLAVGLSYLSGNEFGDEDFRVDALQFRQGWNARVDLDLGSTRFRYLTKHDAGRGWYDAQLSIYQVVGCLELFVVSKKFDKDFRFGFKIRVDQFVDLLQRRDFQRTKPVPGTLPNGPP